MNHTTVGKVLDQFVGEGGLSPVGYAVKTYTITYGKNTTREGAVLYNVAVITCEWQLVGRGTDNDLHTFVFF